MVEVSVSILNVKDDKAIQTLYNLETSGEKVQQKR